MNGAKQSAFALGLLAAVVAALILTAFGPASAQATDAHAIILKMIGRDPSLQSYRARVHVNVRMLNFPYVAPKLDGTTPIGARIRTM
jgi:hypothetical protein